jgi:hypothetical protein
MTTERVPCRLASAIAGAVLIPVVALSGPVSADIDRNLDFSAAETVASGGNVVELEQIGSGNDSNVIYVLQQGDGNLVDGDGSLADGTTETPVVLGFGSSRGLFTFEKLTGGKETFTDNLGTETREVGSVLAPGNEDGTAPDQNFSLAILATEASSSLPGGQSRELFTDDDVDKGAALRGTNQEVFVEQVGDANALSLMADGDSLVAFLQFVGNGNQFDLDIDSTATGDADSDGVTVGAFVSGDQNAVDVLLGRDDFDGPRGDATQEDLSGRDVTAIGTAENTEVSLEVLGNDNDLFVDSDGGSDVVRISVDGGENDLGVFQRGGSNTAVVDFSGIQSHLYVEQTSANNVVTLDLAGDGQEVAIVQNGTLAQ